jgi:hypothetical protein
MERSTKNDMTERRRKTTEKRLHIYMEIQRRGKENNENSGGKK